MRVTRDRSAREYRNHRAGSVDFSFRASDADEFSRRDKLESRFIIIARFEIYRLKIMRARDRM